MQDLEGSRADLLDRRTHRGELRAQVVGEGKVAGAWDGDVLGDVPGDVEPVLGPGADPAGRTAAKGPGSAVGREDELRRGVQRPVPERGARTVTATENPRNGDDGRTGPPRDVVDRRRCFALGE